MKDYVRYYKKITNSNFDSRKYQIHHIDGNRENNDIENLVMLPTKLHQKYHESKSEISNIDIQININLKSVIESGHAYNYFLLDRLNEFNKVWSECCEWCDYKNYLLGKIPNIHNKELI